MSQKLLLLLFLFLVGTGSVKAENKKDSCWTTAGYVGLKFSQVSLSNWAAGGNNAIAFDVQGTYQADFKKGKHIWNNRIELAYGLNKNKGEGTQKTIDKIYLNTNYGYAIYKKLYLSALLNFQSQFSPGYDYSVSRDISVSEFMAPGYLTIGPGLSWIPNNYFTATFSPLTWRGTFVLNDRLSEEGAYGVEPGKKVLSEWGANLKLEGRYEFLKNMTIYSRADFYSNYKHDPQNIDINWEVQLNMAINKWFFTTLTTNLLYDNDIKIAQSDGSKGPRVQFKEILGVGLQFNF